MSRDEDPRHSQDGRRGRRDDLPDDALNPPVQQHPRSIAEAAVDQDMAAAEGDVSRHVGTPDELASVAEMASQRAHEDRRRTWMARHPDPEQ